MKISTITLDAKLNSRIDLNKMKELKIYDIKIKDKKFTNAIICNFNDMEKITFKIFSNGSLQITGIKGLDNIEEIPEKIYKTLKIYEEVILEKNLYKLSDIKIGMIRVYSEFNKSIDLIKLKNYINELNLDGINAAFYSPERFSGLILKYNKNNDKGTIIIFSTGKYSLMANNIDIINKMNNIFKCL